MPARWTIAYRMRSCGDTWSSGITNTRLLTNSVKKINRSFCQNIGKEILFLYHKVEKFNRLYTGVAQNNWNSITFTPIFQRSLESRILIQILVLQFIAIADGAFYLFYCIFLIFFFRFSLNLS